MKVVVTSAGQTMDSEVDSRFGRAAYFLLVDTETDELDAVDNSQDLEAAQGAGIQAAQKVAGLEPEYLIGGHCGPKAFAVLSAAGIKVVVGAHGTVREAVQQLQQGELREVGEADVEGHWV
ncbi:MAG: NifB/NifX family molybdenum-iron cluster-binding protein [Candidatus Eisenbacteria sp.]|nr:NifB/NifX family molybdenum-iron cluster-binding protein [Candidatus Eisenbacteria bacterium]